METTDRVLVSIRQITRAIDMHSRQLIREHGLTVPQLLVLKAALNAPGASVGQVARAVQLSQGTVTQILIRLELRGLLERTRNTWDRRRVAITVTPAGKALLDHAPQPLQEHFLRAFQDLDEWEQSQLLSALQRVAQMMGFDGMDAAPLLTPGDIHEQGENETPKTRTLDQA